MEAEKYLINAISSSMELLGLMMICGTVTQQMVGHVIGTIESMLSWMNSEQISELKRRTSGSAHTFLNGNIVNDWQLHYFPRGYTLKGEVYKGRLYVVTYQNLRPPFIKGQQFIVNYIAL